MTEVNHHVQYTSLEVDISNNVVTAKGIEYTDVDYMHYVEFIKQFQVKRDRL